MNGKARTSRSSSTAWIVGSTRQITRRPAAVVATYSERYARLVAYNKTFCPALLCSILILCTLNVHAAACLHLSMTIACLLICSFSITQNRCSRIMIRLHVNRGL